MSEMNDQTGKLLALEVLLRQANERNGNLNVELAAMTANRDELRREVSEAGDLLKLVAEWMAQDDAVGCDCGDNEVDACARCRVVNYVSRQAKQQAGKGGV